MPRRRRRLIAVSAAFALGGGLLIAPILATQGASAIGGLVIIDPFNGDFPEHAPTFSMNGFAPNGDPLTFLLDAAPHPCSGSLPVDNGLGGWDWFCSMSGPGASPLPGAHTLEVYQIDGVVEDTVNFTVISPVPNVNGLPLAAVRDDNAFAIGGQGNYYGAPITTSEVHVEVVGYPAAGCVTPVTALSFWSCTLDLTGIPVQDNLSLNVWQEDDGVIGMVGAHFLDILPATPTITLPAVGGYDTFAPNVIVGGNYDFSAMPGGSGGQIIVSVTDPDGVVAQYCDTPVLGLYNPAATAWSCDIPLAVGVNDVRMRIQDPVTLGYTLWSNTVNVRRGTATPVALSSPANGSTVSTPMTFAGTGPALGLLEVQYRETGSGLPFNTECTNQVDDDGTWTCPEAIPVGDWDVQVRATDLMGGITTTPVTSFSAIYAKPAMTYTRVGANGISAQADSAAGWLTIRRYSIDYTSDPTQYSWGAPIPGPCPPSVQFTVTCSFGSPELAPGIWNIFTVDEHDNPPTAIGSSQDDYFYVPPPPTVTPALNANRTVTISVTREAGTLVSVRDLATSALACTISGPGTGGSCTISPTEGSHEYTAQAQSVGFVADTGTPSVPGDDSFDWFSSIATSVPVVVPAAPPAPAPSPNATPSPTATPWTWSFTVSGPDDGIFRPGDQVTIQGSGVPAGSAMSIELHSTPMKLGTVTAADDGTFTFVTTIPADVEPGTHHFVVTATPPGEAPSTLQEAVDIQLPLVPVEEEPEVEIDPEVTAGSEGGSGSGSSSVRSEPAAPNVLSGSLATFGHIVDDPFVLVLAGGLTIALLFLVAVPTELLNSTLSANTGRLGRVFVAVDDRLERFKAWFIRVTRSRALASGLLVTVLSLIYGFTDPDFGFDLVSLRLVLSLAIGMFILTYLIGWLTGLVSRVTWGVHSQVDLRPSIAIFAVVGVIAARILEFSPGFFVGVVIGLELLQASQRVASRVALLQFSLVVGVSVGAWLWYSALISGGPPTDFGGALLGDTLVALTAEGLTAAVIAILPLRFLEGRELYKESKALWLGTFLVIAFAFALLVLPTAIKGTEVGDVGVWVIVFAIFAVVTFALWATFAAIDRRHEAAESEGEERNTAQHDKARG